MAEDTIINPGSGGDRVANAELNTDNGVDVSALSPKRKMQRVRLAYGTGTSATNVSTVTPLPVADDRASTLTSGRKVSTTPGVAVAIRAALACKWVTVTALKTNVSQVNVGGAGVLAASGTQTGEPLDAGESVTYPTTDAELVFLDVRVSGEGVTFTVGS